ncbi:MAG: ATP-binding protein [Alphaproteobacteria bacterium]|nr:ATP-binding protein [Alphaproteobacteria bacterium]
MIIGRKKETEILKKAFHKKGAELIALYGRRRVGKTFLVRQLFGKEPYYFELTGIKDASLKVQLENFAKIFESKFFGGVNAVHPRDWLSAFALLTTQIQKINSSHKIVLFFDELPWLASNKSGFMQALDYYWNRHWSEFLNLTVIVCGSGASWMLDKLINAKGGLHNRLTNRILLEPFTLKETQDFLSSKGFQVHKNFKLVLDYYMVLGGIPYYLNMLESRHGSTLNIETLCFKKTGLLVDEFPKLFSSLFKQSEVNLAIIRLIAKHHYGMSREALLHELKISSGGRINKRLQELESTGFIQSFIPFDSKIGTYYKVIDEYSLFYLSWIEPSLVKGFLGNYWSNQIGTPRYYAWAGYAFESVCFKHRRIIADQLGIQSVVLGASSWHSKKSLRTTGAQIDLLFECKDRSIYLCEIKFKESVYEITKEEGLNLKNKIHSFMEAFPGREILLSLISASGLKRNIWSEGLISHVVTAEDLLQ